MSIDAMAERYGQIAREFELPGEEAINLEGTAAAHHRTGTPRSLLAVLAALPTLDEEFPPIKDLPTEPVDL
jgi:antitoxin VapB